MIFKAYCKEDKPDSSTIFYELPKNIVDVVFVGDSHGYCTYIPKMIFDETGISSANLGSGNQNIINSYWITKEVFKKQNPKIVLIDVHSIEASLRKNDDIGSLSSGLSMMPDFSINKYLAYYNLKNTRYESSKNLKLDNIIGLLQYNDTFGRDTASLTKLISFIINPTKYYSTFGFDPKYDVFKNNDLKQGEYIKEDVIFEESEEYQYLIKLNELCKANGSELIIARSLYNSDTTNLNVIDKVFVWAEENDVEVFDMFDHLGELDINLQTDFKDETHFNYWGAKKATKLFIKEVLSKYNLINHENDKKYSLWQNANYDYTGVDKEIESNVK